VWLYQIVTFITIIISLTNLKLKKLNLKIFVIFPTTKFVPKVHNSYYYLLELLRNSKTNRISCRYTEREGCGFFVELYNIIMSRILHPATLMNCCIIYKVVGALNARRKILYMHNVTILLLRSNRMHIIFDGPVKVAM